MTPDSIVLNELKHCLKSIIHFINESVLEFDKNRLCIKLNSIGNSQMDLYTGTLDKAAILNESIHILIKTNIDTPQKYSSWIKENNAFVSFELSDHSVWIFREGINEEKYIHIHPARYSLHTTRVKANSLKTAIAAIVVSKIYNQNINSDLINYCRTNLLHLSPVKELEVTKGIERMHRMIKQAE